MNSSQLPIPAEVIEYLNLFLNWLYTDYQAFALWVAIGATIAIPIFMFSFLLVRGQNLRLQADGGGYRFSPILRLLMNVSIVLAVGSWASIIGSLFLTEPYQGSTIVDRLSAYRFSAMGGMAIMMSLMVINTLVRPESALTDTIMLMMGEVKRRDDELGSAHFADRHEYKRFAQPYPHGLTLYGEFRGEEHGKKRYRILGDTFSLSPEDAARGVITIGNPGSGKSQSVILPIIADTMKEKDSIIVTDPQGELKHEILKFAKVTGHIVIIHDPTDENAARYNLAHGINSVTLATSVANVISGGGGEGYWEKAATGLFAGCLMRYDSIGDIAVAMNDMKRLAKELKEPGDDASFLTADWTEAAVGEGARQALGVISTLKTNIQAWADSKVRAATDVSDIQAEMLLKKPVALILTVPSKEKSALAPYLGACMTRLLLELDSIGEKLGGALPRPVKFIIDEFPAMGNLEVIVEQANLVRKRRISFILAAQTIGQLRRIYGPDGASTLLAGMATNIIFGGTDKDTAQHYAQLGGNMTKEVDPETGRKIERPLLTSTDIISPPHAPQGNVIIFSRYVTAQAGVNAIILARLTRMYERTDWQKAIKAAEQKDKKPRLYTRQHALHKQKNSPEKQKNVSKPVDDSTAVTDVDNDNDIQATETHLDTTSTVVNNQAADNQEDKSQVKSTPEPTQTGQSAFSKFMKQREHQDDNVGDTTDKDIQTSKPIPTVNPVKTTNVVRRTMTVSRHGEWHIKT